MEPSEKASTDPWADFVREALRDRLSGDSRYAEHRVGFDPTEEQIRRAVTDEIVSAAVEELVVTLDRFEADAWDNLKESDP